MIYICVTNAYSHHVAKIFSHILYVQLITLPGALRIVFSEELTKFAIPLDTAPCLFDKLWNKENNLTSKPWDII